MVVGRLLYRILVFSLLSVLLFHFCLTTYLWFTYGEYIITYVFWWEKWVEIPTYIVLTVIALWLTLREVVDEVKRRT